MGYIKEPDGIDFVINGKPLTDKQKQAISQFIKADKEKRTSLEKRPTKANAKNRKTIA
jgi:hypothetical protein